MGYSMSTGADGSGGGGFGSARMSSMSHLPAGGKRHQVIPLGACQYIYPLVYRNNLVSIF